MLYIDGENKFGNTDRPDGDYNHWILRFDDTDEADFYLVDRGVKDVFSAGTLEMTVGEWCVNAPYHWSILCVDSDSTLTARNIETIPLVDLGRGGTNVLTVTPQRSFRLGCASVRMRDVFTRNVSWSAPPLEDNEMMLVPVDAGSSETGPTCIILGSQRKDIRCDLGGLC